MADEQQLGFLDWLFGKRRFYQVFTAPHRLEFKYDLQSRQATYKFVASVSATAELRDAIATVRHGLRSTSDTLRQPIEEALQQAVRMIDFRNTDKAWADGLVALKQVRHDLIQLSNIVLMIEPDPAAREPIRTIEAKPLNIEAWKADSEIKQYWRNDLLEGFRSLNDMLARLVTETDPQTRAVLREAITLKMQRDEQVTQRQIEAFRFVVDSGRLDEMDIPAGLSKLLEQIEKTYGGGLPAAALLGSSASEGDEAEGGKTDGGKTDGGKTDGA